MPNPKVMYCSKCKKRVGAWDGKSTIDVICKCTRCNKRIIYHVASGVTETKELPPRTSSSGVNFSY